MDDNINNFKFNFIDNDFVRVFMEINKNTLFADFQFLLQPILEPKTAKLYAFEVLSRVTRTSSEFMESEDFFNYLDDDLIKFIAITKIQWIKKVFISNRKALKFSLNIPFTCIEDKEFLSKVSSLHRRNVIAFEINFDGHTSNVIKNRKIKTGLDMLRRNNFLLFFDNFRINNRYNLNLLYIFHWDLVKLDRELLVHYHLDGELGFLIKAVSSHCSMVALQGIETSYQYNQFKNIVSLMQGYYFLPPLNHIDAMKAFNVSGMAENHEDDRSSVLINKIQ